MLDELKPLIRAPYFDTYLEHLTSADLKDELGSSSLQLSETIAPLSERKMDHRYEEGKWSIRQVVQHLIDTEMIFNYRAITIGRSNASQVLPGFDHDAYAEAADLSRLTGPELIESFQAVRVSTQYLYQTFTKEELERVGTASGYQVQVKSLFYISAGHTWHHLNVIREKYLS